MNCRLLNAVIKDKTDSEKLVLDSEGCERAESSCWEVVLGFVPSRIVWKHWLEATIDHIYAVSS